MIINIPGHMTKMVTMPIYGKKNPSKIFYTELKLRLEYYNLCINHDPVMTLTDFMARSS